MMRQTLVRQSINKIRHALASDRILIVSTEVNVFLICDIRRAKKSKLGIQTIKPALSAF